MRPATDDEARAFGSQANLPDMLAWHCTECEFGCLRRVQPGDVEESLHYIKAKTSSAPVSKRREPRSRILAVAVVLAAFAGVVAIGYVLLRHSPYESSPSGAAEVSASDQPAQIGAPSSAVAEKVEPANPFAQALRAKLKHAETSETGAQDLPPRNPYWPWSKGPNTGLIHDPILARRVEALRIKREECEPFMDDPCYELACEIEGRLAIEEDHPTLLQVAAAYNGLRRTYAFDDDEAITAAIQEVYALSELYPELTLEEAMALLAQEAGRSVSTAFNFGGMLPAARAQWRSEDTLSRLLQTPVEQVPRVAVSAGKLMDDAIAQYERQMIEQMNRQLEAHRQAAELAARQEALIREQIDANIQKMRERGQARAEHWYGVQSRQAASEVMRREQGAIDQQLRSGRGLP